MSMKINSNVLMPYIMGRGGGGLEHGKKVKPVLPLLFFQFSFVILFVILFSK